MPCGESVIVHENLWEEDKTFDSIWRVSRSSRMFLYLFITSSKYNAFIGWYTYRIFLVSTYLCCLPLSTSFGNSTRSLSIRILDISMNYRETRVSQPEQWMSLVIITLEHADWGHKNSTLPCARSSPPIPHNGFDFHFGILKALTMASTNDVGQDRKHDNTMALTLPLQS